MPQVYLPKDEYDAICRLGQDPTQFVKEAVKVALEKTRKEVKR